MPKNLYFPVLVQLLPKDDPRHQKWLAAIKRRPPPWSKGKTKDTDERVRKISDTFKRKKINNFATWQQKMKKLGLIRSYYPTFKKDYEFAFLIGLTLGDGNIGKFPRAERLLITLNCKYPALVDYTAYVMGKLFEKPAVVKKSNKTNCMRIWIYQKEISKRMQIIYGNRRNDSLGIPKWIWSSKKCIIGCLKGLFEAEGSLSIHLPTYTYNFQFSNNNSKLLKDVERGLRVLGFNPEIRKNAVRLRKKREVFVFKDLIEFRQYNIAG